MYVTVPVEETSAHPNFNSFPSVCPVPPAESAHINSFPNWRSEVSKLVASWFNIPPVVVEVPPVPVIS